MTEEQSIALKLVAPLVDECWDFYPKGRCLLCHRPMPDARLRSGGVYVMCASIIDAADPVEYVRNTHKMLG